MIIVVFSVLVGVAIVVTNEVVVVAVITITSIAKVLLQAVAANLAGDCCSRRYRNGYGKSIAATELISVAIISQPK